MNKAGLSDSKNRNILICGIIVMALLIFAAGPVLASESADSNSGTRQIVVFQSGLVDQAEKDRILSSAGMKKVKYLPLVNAAVVEAGPEKTKTLGAEHSGILRVEKDARIKVQGIFRPGEGKAGTEVLPWGVDRIDADRVWDRNNNLKLDLLANAGNHVRVAVMDTGVDLDHPDLKKNIKRGFNAVDPGKAPEDGFGHGTHVAGTIAAVDNKSGIIGVAPKAWIYPVKVMGDDGSGTISDVIEALDWCISNKMQVVNMSFATPEDIESLHEALAKAYNSGIVLVAAAGNHWPGEDSSVQYPAKYPEVIAVSAADKSDALTPWSDQGPEIELAAPGEGIYSTFNDGGYISGDGTSMAAPHVSGTAALIIGSGVRDFNKNCLINDEVRARLQQTAEDLGDTGSDSLYGYGMVDAEEAAKRQLHPDRQPWPQVRATPVDGNHLDMEDTAGDEEDAD